MIAFTGGITIFRQTKAIWKMNSSNAVTINNTLNSFTFLEPLFILIVAVGCIIGVYACRMGF